MASTVFFHNGFGDYVINRGALALLARRLPRPVRLVHGDGPHAFLVRDLPFDAFTPVQVSGPNGGLGRRIALPAPDAADRSDVLVNLASWEGEGIEQLRARLAPRRYVWNAQWREWDAHGPNAVELAWGAVRALYPETGVDQLRLAPAFDAPVGQAVERMLRQLAQQGYPRHLSVHLDSSEDKPWPLDALGRAVCAVLARHPDLCVLVVGRSDRLPRCACHGRRVLFLQGFSLQASMNVVARGAAFLGVDSVMMKVADVCGVGGAAVFATRRDASRWGYFWTPARQAVLAEQDGQAVEREVAQGLLAALAPARAPSPATPAAAARCD